MGTMTFNIERTSIASRFSFTVKEGNFEGINKHAMPNNTGILPECIKDRCTGYGNRSGLI